MHPSWRQSAIRRPALLVRRSSARRNMFPVAMHSSGNCHHCHGRWILTSLWARVPRDKLSGTLCLLVPRENTDWASKRGLGGTWRHGLDPRCSAQSAAQVRGACQLPALLLRRDQGTQSGMDSFPQASWYILKIGITLADKLKDEAQHATQILRKSSFESFRTAGASGEKVGREKHAMALGGTSERAGYAS